MGSSSLSGHDVFGDFSFLLMPVMIKLMLPKHRANFSGVQTLPGLAGLDLDESFGLVPIEPSKGLYVVRSAGVDDLQRRKEASPEIVEVSGDIEIAPF